MLLELYNIISRKAKPILFILKVKILTIGTLCFVLCHFHLIICFDNAFKKVQSDQPGLKETLRISLAKT